MATDDYAVQFSGRFNKLLSKLNISAYKLAKELDTSEAVVSNMKNGKTAPNSILLSKLLKFNKAINLNWLLTGEGKMMTEPYAVLHDTDEFKPNVEEKIKYLPDVVVTDDKGDEVIFFLDSKAAAGHARLLTDSDYLRKLPTLKIPRLRPGTGTYICAQITGDSMEPTLYNNAYVVGKLISEPSKQLKGGEICLVLNDDGFVCKRVYPNIDNKHLFELRSDNNLYSPYTEDATLYNHFSIYKYECHIDFNTHVLHFNFTRQLNAINNRISELEKNIK